MNRIRLNLHIVIELILLVAVIVLLLGNSPAVARAVPVTMAAVPGGPGFVTVSAYAFVPYYPPPFPGSSFEFDGVTLVNTSSNVTLDNFRAPVYLPHGATINKITMYFYDNSLENPVLRLVNANMAQVSGWILATASGTGSSGSFRNVSNDSINHVVDLSNYVYYLSLDLPVSTSIKFAGARVDYNFPTMLPLLAKENH